MKIQQTVLKWKQDKVFRSHLSMGISLLANLAFLLYNFFVGVVYRLVWNFSVSFYYLLLTMAKSNILYKERKWKTEEKEVVEQERIKLSQKQSIVLFLIDVVLIAPIVLLVSEQRMANIGQIPAIAIATYTTYKITMSCIHYAKAKKSENTNLKTLRVIRLKEGIVSVITLQNTLIAVFGDVKEMWLLAACSSAGLLALVICLSVLECIRVYK